MRDKGYSVVANWNYVIISVVVTAVITLMVLYMPNLRDFDKMLLKSIQSISFPCPKFIPIILNEILRNYCVWPLIAAGGILVSHKMYVKAFLLVFFTQAAYFLTDLVKGLICRERPCEYAGYSFPSGHSLISMCFFGILIYLVSRYVSGFWKYFLITLFGVLIFFAGISRLWLGVHFPTDVIAGMFMGFMLVNLYIITCKALGE